MGWDEISDARLRRGRASQRPVHLHLSPCPQEFGTETGRIDSRAGADLVEIVAFKQKALRFALIAQ